MNSAITFGPMYVAVDGLGKVPGPLPHYRGRFEARAESVGLIRGEVAAIGRDSGLDRCALSDLSLAVSEAATNAVVHGSAGIDNAHVHVSVDFADEQLHVIVSDDGDGLKPRTDSPGAGLGLPIMAAITGQLDVCSSAQGTEVHMTFPCSG